MDKRLLAWWRQPRKWAGKKTKTASFWLVLLALLVLLVSLWVMFGDMTGCDAGWIYKRLGVTEKAAALKTLGFIIAGIVALLGVVVANRRAKALADSAKAADDTAKAAEAGNRQRAFKDGVEHLGSGQASVRQGGAHALFHLALKDEGLRASIAGVLCAHIQETTGAKKYQEQNKGKPSTEMQSLLRLLFTTETADVEGRLARFWQGITPNLDFCYFRRMQLSNAQWRGAKLNATQFQGALLSDANFQGTSLLAADLQWASLIGARFQGAYLYMAKLQGADLQEAQFQGAGFYRTGLQQAKFNNRSEFRGISSKESAGDFQSFEQRIEDRANKKSDFSGVIFEGGMSAEDVAAIEAMIEIEGSILPRADVVKRLKSEIGQPEVHTKPNGVIDCPYNEEDAERWIQEYREAMGTAPTAQPDN